jgi:hypothetical protein
MSYEPALRFVIERRFRKPPPAPCTNKWEPVWSFSDKEYADEGLRDERSDDRTDAFEFRLVDTCPQEEPV